MFSHGGVNLAGVPDAKEAIYPGETAWSGSERAKEHLDDYKDIKESSHMVKHFTSSHCEDQERPQFGMRVVRYTHLHMKLA